MWHTLILLNYVPKAVILQQITFIFSSMLSGNMRLRTTRGEMGTAFRRYFPHHAGGSVHCAENHPNNLLFKKSFWLLDELQNAHSPTVERTGCYACQPFPEFVSRFLSPQEVSLKTFGKKSASVCLESTLSSPVNNASTRRTDRQTDVTVSRFRLRLGCCLVMWCDV